MKIIQFKVFSDFRNLQGVELRFDVNVNTYVLIGNNGAGKSSLLEALSSIFQTLFLGGSQPFEFAFLLVFKSDGRMISIINQPNASSIFKLDGCNTNRNALSPYLPQRVICNYSGEETRIRDRYYLPVWKQYERRLKATASSETLRMVFVDKDLWKIILFVIVAHQERYQSFKTFLKDILQAGDVASIKLDINKKALGAWSDNPVSYYMRRLTERIQPDGTIYLPDINPDDYEALFIFNHLSSARSLIKNIQIVFDNRGASDFLSEGEKKWMVVLFILEVISDERSLVLLDEPDSHIHVARQRQMAEMFRKAVNRDNIVTSHSPTLTAAFDRKEIIMLDRGPDGCAKVVDADKQRIVSELTDGMWSIQKQNIFLASNNDIILVEGKWDDVYLSKALDAFKTEGRFLDHSYEFLPCGGAGSIAGVMPRFLPKPDQRLFCLFDNDKAGWEGINACFVNTSACVFDHQTFGKARKCGAYWVLTCPCTEQEAGKFNIEDYFPRSVLLRHLQSFNFFNEIISKDTLKKKLAEDCKNAVMQKSDFLNFAAIFSLLDDIRMADAAGKDHI